MYRNEFPHGYNYRDTVEGTVVRESIRGIEVAIGDDPWSPDALHAFASCRASLGERVLVTLLNFDSRRNRFFAVFDGYATTLRFAAPSAREGSAVAWVAA